MNRLKYYFPFVCCISIILSLFFYEFARASLSISMFGLIIGMFIFNFPKQWFLSFLHNPPYLSLGLIGLSLVLFMFNSSNIAYAWNRIELRGALFGLAIAFASMPKFKEQDFNLLMLLYVGVAFGVCIYTGTTYLRHYNEINYSYLEAKTMPTILNHVRFSIMVAMAAYIAYYLFVNDYKYWIFSKYILLGIAILLIVFLHVYSVRSGLIAVYAMFIVELWKYIVRTKKYRMGLFIATSCVIVVVTAILTIPTLHNKWQNTKADVNTYITKGYPNYNSLTTRLISFEAALFIFEKNPIFGCGIGDIKDETDLYFKEHYPMIDIPILPHNQFLFYLAATGIIGLLCFSLLFYFPLWYKSGYKNSLLLMQYVVLTFSFMTEPMLETQLGMGYSIFFLLLSLNQIHGKSMELS